MTNTLYDEFIQGAGMHCDNGSELAPLFTWRGRNVYPLFGAEGDEDGDGGADSEPDTDEDDDAGDGGSGEGSNAVTREEFDQLRKQLSASDKNRAAAEKKLKDIEDAKKDELTKATERAEVAEKRVQQQDEELSSLRLQNAFLTANTGVTWHDPEDALDVAQRRGYLKEVVGEDGSVDKAKLTAKLKELAKVKPHLVKSWSENSDDKGKEPKGTAPTGQKIGSKPSGNGGDKGDKLPSRYDKFLTR